MDFAGIFDKNFFSFAGMLGGAPGGGLLPLGGASLAAASGQPHAGENYALLASGACADDVEKAARFFAERGAEFVTPWLPQTPHSIARTLEERGIERRRIYTSMYLPVEAERGHGSPEVAAVTAEDAARWGEAAWYAFGGEAGEAAKAYVPFGEYLANHPKNQAFALEEQGRYVSTALIHETDEAYGLYYFATVPERRRQGLAAKLMDGVTAALPRRSRSSCSRPRRGSRSTSTTASKSSTRCRCTPPATIFRNSAASKPRRKTNRNAQTRRGTS